jgi:hypothetical protein
MGTFALTAIKEETAGKISKFVNTKAVKTVISQNPAAGTPVIQGMTIELTAVSLSDVPWNVVAVDAPVLVRNVPVDDIQTIINSDPVLAAAAKSGTITDNQKAEIAQKVNAGLAQKGVKGELNVDDAANLVKSAGSFGLFD